MTTAIRLCAAAAIALSAARASAQIKDDKQALAKLKCLLPGYEVRLFAGSDICHNPTSIDVDIYGRVWVCEGMNYRTSLNKNQPWPADPEADRIKVLEDTDCDGVADKVTVFVNKIPVVPMTVCVAGDKVFWGYPPNMYVSEGADAKNPVAKNTQVLLSGFKGRDHDHCIHGFNLGPDGRLYMSIGDQGLDVTDKSGVRHNPRAASQLRVNLDGTKMRLLADNMRNPYESCVDSFGRVFCSDNDDDGNAQVRINYVIDGGNYGYTAQQGTPASPTRHHWREDVPGITHKVLRTGAGSPCGILVYEGKMLPERFVGSLIHCDNGAPRTLRAYHLKPAGAGYSGVMEDLVTSDDQWYRPVDVAHAPDGSLYFADWYDGGVGGHAYRDKIIGRIYHLTKIGAPPSAKVAAPELKTVPGLVSALMSPLPAVRFLAIQGLRERGNEAAAALAALARDGKHPLERARALWASIALGEAGRPAIVNALNDSDPRLRAVAVRILREEAQKNLEHIAALAGDENAEVRLEVAVALRDVPTDKAKAALAKLAAAADAGDIFYMPTLAGTLRKREPEFVMSLFAPTGSADEQAKALALAWQLNRVESVPFLTGVLSAPKAPEHYQAALDALSWIAEPAAGEAVSAAAAAQTDVNRRRAALAVLRGRLGSTWKALADKPALTGLIEKGLTDPATATDALALVGAAQIKAFAPRLIALAENSKADRAVRRAAIDAMGQFRTAEMTGKLEGLLKSARVTGSAEKGVPQTDETVFQALAVLHATKSAEAAKVVDSVPLDAGYPAALRREAVRLLGQSPAGCRTLLSAFEKGALPADLKDEVAAVTNRSADAKVREAAAKVLPLPKKTLRQLPSVEKILAKAGDAAKGEKVFFKKEAQCSKCHRVGGVGAWVGPDLSQIGGKLSRDGLLYALLYPSDGIAHEYVQYAVRTKGEQVFAGLVLEETAERIILKNAEGDRIVVAAADIDAKRAMPVSIMPEGLAHAISDGELADLLSYLSTLRKPSLVLPEYRLAGPVPADAAIPATVDLKGSAPAWRKASADREGRLDLESALGARAGAGLLYASLTSAKPQAGRVVVLLPAGAKATGTLNGKPMALAAATVGSDPKAGTAWAADVQLDKGGNALVIKVTGDGKAALFAVTTVVSTEGVEIGGW